MKFCSVCKEEFADKFSFCPVDGTPLTAVTPPVEEPSLTVDRDPSVTVSRDNQTPAIESAAAYSASRAGCKRSNLRCLVQYFLSPGSPR